MGEPFKCSFLRWVWNFNSRYKMPALFLRCVTKHLWLRACEWSANKPWVLPVLPDWSLEPSAIPAPIAQFQSPQLRSPRSRCGDGWWSSYSGFWLKIGCSEIHIQPRDRLGVSLGLGGLWRFCLGVTKPLICCCQELWGWLWSDRDFGRDLGKERSGFVFAPWDFSCSSSTCRNHWGWKMSVSSLGGVNYNHFSHHRVTEVVGLERS